MEVTLVVARQIPEGCRCSWSPRHTNYGGDVYVSWTLMAVEPSCPRHGRLGKYPAPVTRQGSGGSNFEELGDQGDSAGSSDSGEGSSSSDSGHSD